MLQKCYEIDKLSTTLEIDSIEFYMTYYAYRSEQQTIKKQLMQKMDSINKMLKCANGDTLIDWIQNEKITYR